MSPIVSKCYIHVHVNWWPFFKRLPIACADDLYFEWLALTEPSVTAAKVAVAKEIGRQMWIPSTWHHCTLVPLWYLAPLHFGATMVPGASFRSFFSWCYCTALYVGTKYWVPGATFRSLF